MVEHNNDKPKKSAWTRLSEAAVGTLVVSLIAFSFGNLWREMNGYKEDVAALQRADMERRYAVDQLTQLVSEQQEVLAERAKVVSDLVAAIQGLLQKDATGTAATFSGKPKVVLLKSRLSGVKDRESRLNRRMDAMRQDIRHLRRAKR